MDYSFFCTGHENILALHKTTIEFTKESNLTKNGDCIIGVNSDFECKKLIGFISANKGKRITAEIIVGKISDSFAFSLNPGFLDKHEIVIRKTDFLSARTLGICSNKSAVDINREIINEIKDENKKMKVVFRG